MSAVDDSLLMGMLNRLADRDEQLQPLAWRQVVIVTVLGDGFSWTSSMRKYAGHRRPLAPGDEFLSRRERPTIGNRSGVYWLVTLALIGVQLDFGVLCRV
jgi:hypothetical protein